MNDMGDKRVTIQLPTTCVQCNAAWELCRHLDELLKMNPHLKREDIIFSDHYTWIKTKGYLGE